MDVGRGDEDRQHQAQRAGQDMALDPLDLLVAVETALAFLRPGHDALRVHDDGRRFRRVTPRLADPPRQQSGRIRPDAIGPEAVMPSANRLPGAEILRKRPPLATGVFQVKTGIHHLPDVRGVGQGVREQRLYGRPLHIRQVARIPPPVILVLLAIFGRPHADLPSRITNSRRRVSVKQALKGRISTLDPATISATAVQSTVSGVPYLTVTANCQFTFLTAVPKINIGGERARYGVLRIMLR